MVCTKVPLFTPGRGDVEIIVLRAHRGRLRAQRLLHRRLAARQLLEIGADEPTTLQAFDRYGVKSSITVGSALIARFSFGTYSPSPFLVSHWSWVNSQMSTPIFAQHLEAARHRGGRDQMLLDRVHGGIDDRAAVEGADRKRDRKRLDQEAHADRRAGWR